MSTIGDRIKARREALGMPRIIEPEDFRRYKSHGDTPVEYRYYVCTTRKRMHTAGDHVRAVPAGRPGWWPS